MTAATCRLVSTGVFFVFLLGDVMADIVLTPPGVSLGEPYHLAFISSATTTAYSHTIADYDKVVQNAADVAGVGIGSPIGDITWLAMGNTQYVDAIDHLSISAPVYLIDGTQIATGSADLWDGTILSAIDTNELGNITSATRVWTGSDISANGTKDPSNTRVLGGTGPGVGIPNATDSGWARATSPPDSLSNGTALPLYAFSAQITAVPEPSMFIPLGLIAVGFVGSYWFSRKKPLAD